MAFNSESLNFLRHSMAIDFQTEANGLSRDQVRRTLAKLPPLADEIERLQNKLADFEQRALHAEQRLMSLSSPAETAAPQMPAISNDFDETLRNTLVSAQRQADTTVADAAAEAERLRSEAEFQAGNLIDDAKIDASELIQDAERKAEQSLTELEIERTSQLEKVIEEVTAQKLVLENELTQSHSAQRDELVSQISDLQETHHLLTQDVARFEEHLKKRRDEVRQALAEVSEVLDDPEKLRSEAPLVAADLPEFHSDEFVEPKLEVSSLNEVEDQVASASAAFVAESEVEVSEVESELVDDGPFEFTSDLDIQNTEIVDADYETNFEPEVFIEEPVHAEAVQPQPAPQPQPQPAPASSDPYLDELHRVTTQEPGAGDPLTTFLEDGDSDKSSGWFGRKK